jgi:uncharacterized OsmC-like protein
MSLCFCRRWNWSTSRWISPGNGIATPPQYFKTVDVVIHLTGKNLNAKKVARAVSLAHEKYCSVYNSLRKDMDVRVSYTIMDTASDNELTNE